MLVRPLLASLLLSVLAMVQAQEANIIACPIYVPAADDLIYACPTKCTTPSVTLTTTKSTTITRTIFPPCPTLGPNSPPIEKRIVPTACPTPIRPTVTLPCSLCTARPTIVTATATVQTEVTRIRPCPLS
ncbi:hypothetical protein FRB91_002241 [Serendipita sp. 411]|nr:hypothetical protein FRB91_002241 [Serendipita sp. 411]